MGPYCSKNGTANIPRYHDSWMRAAGDGRNEGRGGRSEGRVKAREMRVIYIKNMKRSIHEAVAYDLEECN